MPVPRTPTAELAARGSWRAKLPERQNEIQVPVLHHAPNPPEWMSPEARELWMLHAEAGFSEGLLTEIDLPITGLMFERIADYLEAKQRGDKIAMKDACKDAITLADRCGHTPTSRIGLPRPDRAPKAKQVVPFAKG
jgi:phage terminase small subunit